MPRAQKYSSRQRLAIEKLRLDVELKRQRLKSLSPDKPPVPSMPRRLKQELKRIERLKRANRQQEHLVSMQTDMHVDNITLMQSKRWLTRLIKEDDEATSAFLKEESERRGIDL